jgi:hypothetical protein
MVLAHLLNKMHNCKIHGTTAKQSVQLQKNAQWQFSFALHFKHGYHPA